jgi:myo-inositol 2-dehydrogenase / D-chiro-inositol 1-dehydrogenase
VAEVHAVAAASLPGGAETATAAVLIFADGPVGTFTTTCVLPGKHRAGLEIVADGMVLGVGEDWLEVSTANGTRRAEFDPWRAREAVDRAFVDVLRGVPVSPGWQPPDHADALRSHRLACALGRSVTSGRAEQLRWASLRATP